MDGCMQGLVIEWMDGWMDGWLSGWMHAWMSGRVVDG